jgi:site-specific DNA-cytosine methylase
VDLFAGAGGMSLGMEKYFNVKWVVDNNEIACSTLNSNKKNSNVLVYTEDVRKFILRSMKGNPCYPSVGEVDHIHASRE